MVSKVWTRTLGAMALSAALGACMVNDDGLVDPGDHGALGSSEQHAYIETSTAWPMASGNATVSVCWETAGFAVEKAWVQSFVEGAYEQQPYFHVDFVGWGACGSGDIRIRIRDERPEVSDLGRDIDWMKLNFRYLSFGPACSANETVRRRCIEQAALHEFGHALGLAHERNRPDRDPDCDEEPQGRDGNVLVGNYDPDSIMNYCAHGVRRLSEGDVAGLSRLYGGGGDVFVTKSDGTRFPQIRARHDMFSLGGEVPLTGDFNGDSRSDLVTFTRGTTGDVYVALSNGSGFGGAGWKWHDAFSFGHETPLVGNFDGVNGDDIATIDGDNADVYVALANAAGTEFVGTGWKWNESLCGGSAVCKAGDVNRDGKDDIVMFTRGSAGNVYVALSTGAQFLSPQLWATHFAHGSNLPEVGDVDGDGDADIVSFTRGSSADVWVALSSGASFVDAGMWHDLIVTGGAIPAVADINGDHRADVVSFTRGNEGKVWVALSTGSAFTDAGGGLWAYGACLQNDVCVLGDVDAFDRGGYADIIAFKQN